MEIGLSPTKMEEVSIMAMDSLILLQRQKIAQRETMDSKDSRMKAAR